MSLVKLLVNKPLNLLFLAVLFDLPGQLRQIVEVVLPLHFQIVRGDDILLFLLPVKLLSLKITDFLYFFALLFKPLVGLLIDCLDILHEVLALSLGVVVHLKRPLGPKEIGVGVVVILVGDVLAVQGKANQIVHLERRRPLIIVHQAGNTLAVGSLGSLALGAVVSLVNWWNLHLIVVIPALAAL